MALTGTAVNRAIKPSEPGREAPGSRAGVSALSIDVVTGCARAVAVTDRSCRKLDALFGAAARSYGVNSPEFGLQFAPSRPSDRPTVTSSRRHMNLRRVHAAMRIDLKPFDFAQAVARAGLRTDGTPLARPPAPAVAGTSFQNAMTQALGAVSNQQNQAEALQRELQLDNPAVSLEQTMVAMQKAQIGFQGVLAVRNRLVSAYSEIMNMQV
jgi:flagellar hook-basal body complex protein FliE